MLTRSQQVLKRIVDILLSITGIAFAVIPMIILIAISSLFTRSFGVFFQERVGINAKTFTMFKIKTMREYTDGSIVLTSFGKFLRKTKLDELPQLFNVLFGSMSMVGPRPDLRGYADVLDGDDRIILSVKPGITGPATLKFSNEEMLLSEQENALDYNDTVLWPQKVEINKAYVKNWSLAKDFSYIFKTVHQVFS
ncbi:MAG: sugar transferase [Flavobacteriaceae bacterium]|nr:sugar transferase [Flavobacteriaceae bacterium]